MNLSRLVLLATIPFALGVLTPACTPSDGPAGEGEGEGQVGEGEGEGQAGEGEGEGQASEGEGEGEGDPVDRGAPPDAGPGNGGTGDCGDADPLTNAGWAGFCGDRVDDNCNKDQASACQDIDSLPVGQQSTFAQQVHEECTNDEPCPSTQAGEFPPTTSETSGGVTRDIMSCDGALGDNVIAFAHFHDADNDQVHDFCVLVYESPVVAGEFYLGVQFENGHTPSGPNGNCSSDFGARRYLWFSNLDEGTCDPVSFIHEYAGDDGQSANYDYPADDQKLSNGCRKAVRFLEGGGAAPSEVFTQYFAASRAEAQAKLQLLESAELGCIGIDDVNGGPWHGRNESFYAQAKTTILFTGN